MASLWLNRLFILPLALCPLVSAPLDTRIPVVLTAHEASIAGTNGYVPIAPENTTNPGGVATSADNQAIADTGVNNFINKALNGNPDTQWLTPGPYDHALVVNPASDYNEPTAINILATDSSADLGRLLGHLHHNSTMITQGFADLSSAFNDASYGELKQYLWSISGLHSMTDETLDGYHLSTAQAFATALLIDPTGNLWDDLTGDSLEGIFLNNTKGILQLSTGILKDGMKNNGMHLVCIIISSTLRSIFSTIISI